MSLLIGRYDFEGPLVNRLGVKKTAGLYAVMSYARRDFELVEIAESDNLQAILMNERNLEYWQNKSNGMLVFSVHYCPRAKIGKRREMVSEILREFDGDWHFDLASRELVLTNESIRQFRLSLEPQMPLALVSA